MVLLFQQKNKEGGEIRKMVILKKKMSPSSWILIILAVLAPIVLILGHMFGAWDISFIGEYFMGYVAWQAADGMNAVLGAIGWVLLGVMIFYILKTYIFGTQIPITPYQTYSSGGYNPQPTQPSNPQKDEDTVIT